MPKKLKGPVKQVWESKIKQSPSKNIHVSYSSVSTYNKGPKLWELQYLRNAIPFKQNIYTCFGSAMHETIQEWLEVLYHDKVKTANDMNLDQLLYDKMVQQYKQGKAINGHEHFSTVEELTQFWIDGKHILNYLKKKRAGYFSTKSMMLAGVETLLYQEIKPGIMFKGLVDLVFYHPNSDTWTIMDIKTSTSGWSKYAKNDDKRKSQILLYKEFFSKQFNIPKDKINVEYFILKRKVPVEAEFASMQRRVQEFKPGDGPRKMKQAVNLMENFVSKAVDMNGSYIETDYPTNPSNDACRFCAIKEMRLCPDAVF